MTLRRPPVNKQALRNFTDVRNKTTGCSILQEWCTKWRNNGWVDHKLSQVSINFHKISIIIILLISDVTQVISKTSHDDHGPTRYILLNHTSSKPDLVYPRQDDNLYSNKLNITLHWQLLHNVRRVLFRQHVKYHTGRVCSTWICLHTSVLYKMRKSIVSGFCRYVIV